MSPEILGKMEEGLDQSLLRIVVPLPSSTTSQPRAVLEQFLATLEKSLAGLQQCVERAEKDADELDAFLAHGVEQSEQWLKDLADCRRDLAAGARQSI